MTFVRKGDQLVEDALEHRAGAYHVPSMEALMVPLLEELVLIENAAWEIFDSRFIENASNHQLKLLAAIIGEEGLGDGDEALKTRIRLKLAAQRSLGTPSELFDLAHLLPETTWLVQGADGAVNFVLLEGVTSYWAVLARIFALATADGIQVRIESPGSNDDASENMVFGSQDGEIEGSPWSSADGTVTGANFTGATYS